MSRIVDAMVAGQRQQLANRLKNTSDPNEVVAVIREVVQANLNAQAHGNALVRDKALGDLSMVLKLLRSNQANVGGGDKSKYISVLNRSLEESTKSIKETEETATSMKAVSEAMSDALPSPDSLINALTVANPLVGHGVKLVKQMAVGALKTAMEGKQNRKKQQDILQQEADILAGLTPQQEEQTEEVKKHTRNNSTIIGELKLMNEQFAALYDVWADEVVDSVNAVTDAVNDQTNENKRLEERRRRVELENKRESIQDQPVTVGPDTDVPSDPALTDGIATFLGAFSGTSMGAIGSLLGGIGRFALLATKAVGLGALLAGAYTFFDGFFNAAEILNADETALNFTDRIRAGIGNLAEGISESINGIASFLGFDELIDTEDMNTRIAEGIENIGKGIGSMIFDAQQFIEGLWEDVKQTWDTIIGLPGKAADVVTENVSETYTKVTGAMSEFFGVGEQAMTPVVEPDEFGYGDEQPYYSKTHTTTVEMVEVPIKEQTGPSLADIILKGQSSNMEFMAETKKARDEHRTENQQSAPVIVAPSTTNKTTINQTHTNEVSSPRNNEPVWNRGSLGRGLGYM